MSPCRGGAGLDTLKEVMIQHSRLLVSSIVEDKCAQAHDLCVTRCRKVAPQAPKSGLWGLDRMEKGCLAEVEDKQSRFIVKSSAWLL